MAHISAMRHIAEKCEISERLAYDTWKAYQCRNSASQDMNVRFDEALVRGSPAYGASVTACNPRYSGDCRISPLRESFGRHLAVTVGGLGGKLQQLVKRSVVAWLYELDAMIRRRFSIPLASERGCMNSVGVVVEKFTNLIADRVVHLEERGEDPRPCAPSCSTRDRDEATLQALRRGRRERGHPQHRGLVWVAQGPTGLGRAPRSARRLPRQPVPELLKFLPQVAQQYEFEQLAVALST